MNSFYFSIIQKGVGPSLRMKERSALKEFYQGRRFIR